MISVSGRNAFFCIRSASRTISWLGTPWKMGTFSRNASSTVATLPSLSARMLSRVSWLLCDSWYM